MVQGEKRMKISRIRPERYTALGLFSPSQTIGFNGAIQRLNTQLPSDQQILMFTAGQTGFIPPRCIIDIANTAQHDPQYQKYRTTQGEPELRRSLGRVHNIHPDCIAINPGGSKFTLATTIRMMLRAGNFVLLDCRDGASWKTHRDIINRTEGQTVDLTSDHITYDHILEKTDMRNIDFVLTSRGNPTPYSRTRSEAIALITFAHEKGIKLIVDDAYEGFFKSNPGHVDWLKLEKELNMMGTVIKIISMSKEWSAVGWRMGAALCRDSDFISRYVNMVESVASMAPVHYQLAWNEALNNPDAKEWQQNVISVMHQRAVHYAENFERLGFRVVKGSGIYLWVIAKFLANFTYKGKVEISDDTGFLPARSNVPFRIKSSKDLNMLAIQAARFAGTSGFGTSWGWRISLAHDPAVFDSAFARLEAVILKLR